MQRLLVWQDALQAVAGPRLLIGYGPETQILALEPRYPVELAERFPDTRFDRAHNLVLDTLLTTGLLGLLALLALLVGVARAAIQASTAQLGPSRWVVGGLLGALTAYLIAAQFAFDTAATGALFWMILGLAVAPLVPEYRPSAEPATRQSRRKRRAEARNQGLAPAVRLRATAILAAGAIGLACVPWLTAPFLADLYHTRALALRAGEAPGSSSRQELAAVQSVPWLDVPLLSLAETYLDLARTSTLNSSATISKFDDLFETAPSSRAALFDAARVTLERAQAMNPLDPYPHAAMARQWMMRAEASRDPAEQTDLYGRAVEAYDRAIAAGPSRVNLYDESGVALTRWGKPALALERFKQAESLDRPTAERQSRVADAMLAAGDVASARALYEQALTLDTRSAPAEAGLARLDRAAGNLPAALEHAQRAARFQMRRWEYQRDLALILRDLGQSSDALVAARAARRMAPGWEQDDLTALIQSVSG
jgi:tetratricopeptide (TPR) repeat protein